MVRVPTAEYVVTAAVVLGTAVAVGLLGDGLPPRPRRLAALVAGAVAVVAPALTGHTRAATPEALVVGADMLHLLAGSIWLGGLVGLALVLRDLADRGDVGGRGARPVLRPRAPASSSPWWSTGSVLAWRIVGSWDALVEHRLRPAAAGQGRVRLVAVAIAAWNRYRLLPRCGRAPGSARGVRAPTSWCAPLVAEASVLVVVLAVTGFLVDSSPQAEALGGRPGAEQRADRDARRRRPLQARLTPLTRAPTRSPSS